MAGSDDNIQPFRGKPRESSVGGISPTAAELIIGAVGPTNPHQGLRPIQTQWPPAYLGFVPDAHANPLQVEGVENVRRCTVPVIYSSDGLVNHPGSNPLLAIWSATRQCIGSYDYLVLPPMYPG